MPFSRPLEPPRRSSSSLTPGETPLPSEYNSTSHLLPSDSPYESHHHLVPSAGMRRASQLSASSSTTRIDPRSTAGHEDDISGNAEMRPSIEITPASPSYPTPQHLSLNRPSSSETSHLPTLPPALIAPQPLKPVSSKTKSRLLAARAPSPVPDYIDTGVKGTPPSSLPNSRSASCHNLPLSILGSDLPRAGSAEQGVTGINDPPRQIPECSHKPWPPWKREDGWAGWYGESIITGNLVPSLVLQAFSTGILDATTYADFKTFASNQTGNTILLTVSIIGTTPVLLLLTGLSLSAFLFGALTFGHLGHYMGVRRRLWILTSTTYQICTLILAAVLVSESGPKETQVGGKHEWVVLVLFANMSGAQVAMARQSGSQELPTAPMTSSYVDLMADKYLFVSFTHPKAGPRNRRLSYIVAMIVGGLIGAAIHKYSGSWPVVVVTIGIKVVVFGLMCVVRAEKKAKTGPKV